VFPPLQTTSDLPVSTGSCRGRDGKIGRRHSPQNQGSKRLAKSFDLLSCCQHLHAACCLSSQTCCAKPLLGWWRTSSTLLPLVTLPARTTKQVPSMRLLVRVRYPLAKKGTYSHPFTPDWTHQLAENCRPVQLFAYAELMQSLLLELIRDE